MVIFGGKSVEHEISVISAIQAIKNIDTAKYDVIPVYITKDQEMYAGDDIATIEAYQNIPELLKKSSRVVIVKDSDKFYLVDHPFTKKFKKQKRQIDVAFPIVHGYNVEDGTLQGYLKTIGIPFVGCDVISSAVGMDKYVMKTVLKDCGLPVLDGVIFNKFEYDADKDSVAKKTVEKFPLPVIVKPATLGSSIGITKANTEEELADALELAFSFATKVLIEPAVVDLREINCSVVGDTEEAYASECEEPLNATTILTFEDKYIGNSSKSTGSQGMATLSRKIPADISQEMRNEIRELSVRAFKVLGCNGVVRIDYLLDTKTNKIYINEINTIPGSLSFYLWEPIGISYKSLLDRLVQLALKREREEKSLLSSFDTNVLSMCSTSSLAGSKGKLKV
jgi:D-alanine-D-alanine ligase